MGKIFSKNADFWKTGHNFFLKIFWVNFSRETKSAPKINKSELADFCHSYLILQDVTFLSPFPYDDMETPVNRNALFCVLKNKSLFLPHHWPITAVAW